jgi:AraC-like DNA-binding protein
LVNRTTLTEHRSSVAAGYARALLDYSVANGAQRDALLRASGLYPRDLQDPERMIDFAKYVKLMTTAKALTRDAALALHFGEAYATDDLSIVGLIGMSSKCAADAAAELDRYSRLIADVETDEGAGGRRFGFEKVSDGMLIVDRRKNPNEFPELTESSATRMMQASRRLAAGGTFIKAVYFTHKEPSYRSEYDRIFQIPLFFQSPRNALLLTDGAWQKLRPPLSSDYLLNILKQRADLLLRALPSDNSSVSSKVEALVRSGLLRGEANTAAIALHLGLSRQALYSRLKHESTTFTNIVRELRLELALNCLARDMSVSDTAFRLGFSDPAAFSRAFKRWTGSSPTDARVSRQR